MISYAQISVFASCVASQPDDLRINASLINTSFMLLLNTPFTQSLLEEVFWAMHLPYDPYNFAGGKLSTEGYVFNTILKRNSAQDGRHVARCIPPHLDGNSCLHRDDKTVVRGRKVAFPAFVARQTLESSRDRIERLNFLLDL